MKKIIIIIFIFIVTVSFSTGCESKNLTDYIKEQETSKKEKIGYIKMSKKKFKKLATQKEFQNLMEYLEDEDDDEKQYEYFVVYFGKNKGLYCISPNCLYMDITKNNDGNYIPGSKIYGKIQPNDSGKYKYITEENK